MNRTAVILMALLVVQPGFTGSATASDVPPGFSEVVILATHSIHLKDGVEIRSGDVVANHPVLGPTLDAGVELSIRRNVITPAGFEIRGDSVRIGRGSHIASDVSFNDLENDGTITGLQTAVLGLPVFASLPPFETGTPGGSDVEVGESDTLVLPAGDYGRLDVDQGGTVLFSGGLYSFRSISTDKESALLFEERSRVRVAERLRTKKGTIVGPEPSSELDASDVVFYVAGTNVSDDNAESAAAVVLERDNLIAANFYVPEGKLHFKPSVEALGAFVARDVLAEEGVRLALDSFFNEPPHAVDDRAAVDQGGTVAVLTSSAASVLANDTDPNDDRLTVLTTPVVPPDHGALVLRADGTFSYTHDDSEAAGDRFVYEVCDDGEPVSCDRATVWIDVIARPPNDPPAAADDRAAVARGETVTVLGSGATSLLANDSDPNGDRLTVTTSPVAAPQHGSVLLSSDGTFSYTHDGSETFTDSFVYELCDDGQPVLCDTAVVRLQVRPAGTLRVTITRQGAGSGRVVSDPAGIDCGAVCAADFPAFERIQLFATAGSGSLFAGWSGDDDCLDGHLDGDAHKGCVATFELAPPPGPSFTLTLVQEGEGHGTITSNPRGINCGIECSVAFEAGSTVFLLARPDDAGSVFEGFGGDPDCADGRVTLTTDVTCTASFGLLD